MFALLLIASPAFSTELVWQGYYRGRALLYDSLSLSDSNANEEGTANSIDHRLLLRPSWMISDHAAIHAEVDVMKLTLWGDTPDQYIDPVTGETLSVAQADGVSNVAAGTGIRGWGEAYTDWGRIAIGRMPMQWGSGILWNSGNGIDAEYGDTADRVQASGRIGPVFVMAAFDVQSEGLVGAADDMQAISFAAGYRSETLGVGLLSNYRYRPEKPDPYQAYTGSLWGFAELGQVRAELEAVGVFGGGNLDGGQDDVTVSAVGVMVKGDYQADKLSFGAEFGVASGDDDPSDKAITTFSFDRDHNVGLLLFEEAMPTLESASVSEETGGRTTDAARSGDAVANAIYFRPAVRYKLLPTVEVEGAWVIAARADSTGETEPDQGYGNEFDVAAKWDPHPHVWFQLTLAVFLPGPLYTQYTDPDLGGGFDTTAFGGRIVGAVEF